MSRSFSTAVSNALAASNVAWAYLIQLDFVSGFVRLTNAGTAIAWNGQQWVGAGRMLGVEQIKESADLEAHGVTVSLSGIPSEYLSKVLAEKSEGRPAIVYFAALDANYTPLVDPVAIWSGRMSQPIINMGQTATIRVNCESRLADWANPRIRRYNDADQQVEFPGDIGFVYVEQMTDKRLVWKLPDPSRAGR